MIRAGFNIDIIPTDGRLSWNWRQSVVGGIMRASR